MSIYDPQFHSLLTKCSRKKISKNLDDVSKNILKKNIFWGRLKCNFILNVERFVKQDLFATSFKTSVNNLIGPPFYQK